jgi:poly(A) polymerase
MQTLFKMRSGHARGFSLFPLAWEFLRAREAYDTENNLLAQRFAPSAKSRRMKNNKPKQNSPSAATKPFEALAEELGAAYEAASLGAALPIAVDPSSPDSLLRALHHILMTPRPDWGLKTLARTGALAAVLPECQAMVGFGEGIRHKDVWAHTCQVVRQTPPRLIVRWAGLLHDIGKVPTRRFAPSGEVTFIGHPEVGAKMFGRIARRLPFSASMAAQLRFLIAAHLRAAAYDTSWTDSAVRRFARDAGESLDDLLDLSRADITSKYAEKVRRGLALINALAERIDRVTQQDRQPPALPAGLGHAIMQHFQLSPGPALGRVMHTLKERVEDGELPVGADFSVYLAFIEAQRLLPQPQHR